MLYWLDEERLLAGGSEGGIDRVYAVGLDGSVTPVAEGQVDGAALGRRDTAAGFELDAQGDG